MNSYNLRPWQEKEKEAALAQAKEEAGRIRELAKQEAADLVKRDAITTAAQQRAESIIERSQREAQNLRRDADAYIVQVLTQLEEDLLRSLSVVRNGLRQVEDEQPPVVDEVTTTEEA